MKNQKSTIVVLTIVALVGVGVSHFLSSPLEFSSEIWKSNPERREDMLNNIVKGNLFIGKSQPELVSLLGEPAMVLNKVAAQGKKGAVMKFDVGYDKIGRMNLYLNIDLVSDTAVLVYKYYEKKEE